MSDAMPAGKWVWALRIAALGTVAFSLGRFDLAAAAEAGPGQRDDAADLASPALEVRVQAAIELGRRADRATTLWLVAALKDTAPAVRREAAKALGAIRDAQAVPALIAALGDEEPNVRMYAAYALGEIQDVRAAEGLLQALRDAQWSVRDQAAWALRELRDPALAARYAALLQDEAIDVATAIWILRGLGDETALATVTALLRDASPSVRLRGVRALGPWQAAALEPLLAALDDPDAGVRRRVVAALEKRPGPAVKRALTARLAVEADPAVREAIDQLLRTAYPPPEPAAWWSFDDRNPQIARDVTGRGSDGQIHRATPAAGKVGAGLKFATGSHVTLGKVPKLPMANQGLTVMAWIQPETDRGVVVARGGAACGYSLYLLDGAARFGIRRDQEHPALIAAGREPVGRGWVHLAGVVRSNAIELYVNGKLAARAETDGYLPGNAGQGMEIGGDLGNSPAEITDSFVGIIDEVQVYLTELSEEEIAASCGHP